MYNDRHELGMGRWPSLKKKIQDSNGHFQKLTNSLNKNLVKNKTQNIQTQMAEEYGAAVEIPGWDRHCGWGET